MASEWQKERILGGPNRCGITRGACVRWVITLVALCAYLLLPTKNYYWDGIGFSQTIEDSTGIATLLHPNHLLYNVVGAVPYRILHAGNFDVRAVDVLQRLNAVFGAAAVYCLFGILVRLGASTSVAGWLVSAFAFSGTWWRFSTDADAYILAALLLVLCAALLTRNSPPNPVGVGILHAGAMLIHELAIVFVPVALVGLAVRKDCETSGWKSRRGLVIVIYALVAGTITGGVYLWSYAVVRGPASVTGLVAWALSHSTDSAFNYRFGASVAVSIRSWIQVVFSGRPGAVDYSSPVTVGLVSGMLATACMLAWSICSKVRRNGIKIRVWNVSGFRLGCVWVGSFACFLVFWLPHNTFYKLLALPGLIVLLTSCIPPSKRVATKSPLALFVVLMVLCNLTFAIIPYSKESANSAVEFAIGLKTRLERGAIVYFRVFNSDDWLARYFNPQTSWKYADSIEAIDCDLRSGKSVWVETTALDEFRLQHPVWLDQRTDKAARVALVDERHRIVFVRLVP